MEKISLEKFKKLYRDKFGEDLSDAAALRKATALRNLYLAVYGSPFESAVSQRESKADNNDKNMQ